MPSPIARILIFEDEPKLAQGLRRGLAAKGFAADWYGDSGKGLERALQGTHDLILLDLMMPGIDGGTVCRSVRGAGVMTPLLVLTARTETEFKKDLLESGADDYMVKPFSFDELIARICALLRRPKEGLPTQLSVRDIVLDASNGSVTKGGKEIKLSPRQFALLEYFVRQPDETHSREAIMEHVWPGGGAGVGNVLDAHMKNLRQKLNEPTLFATVRGVGYRMNS